MTKKNTYFCLSLQIDVSFILRGDRFNLEKCFQTSYVGISTHCINKYRNVLGINYFGKVKSKGNVTMTCNLTKISITNLFINTVVGLVF